MIRNGYLSVFVASLCVSAVFTTQANAAESFQLRYNLAGSLGGEMFMPPNHNGPGVGFALTRIEIKKVTGDDGKTLTLAMPSGVVPLPAPAPSSLYPSYGANKVQVDGSGPLTLANLAFGYISSDLYSGGRLAFLANIPYGVETQNLSASGTTPNLNWPNASVPDAATKAAVASQFGSAYQGSLAAQAAAESGKVSGLGDIELQGGWMYNTEQVRVLGGVSLALPTGRYKSTAGPDIGFGNFYTLRPAVQVAYLPTPDWAIAGKLTYGINTRNHDNDLRSGNWVGAEAAIGYKTAVGPIGLHFVQVQQVQDDSNNPWGTSRFQSTNAGLFFTTMIRSLGAVVTVQTMATLDSRNAKSGTFNQIRMIKLF